ncbi:hypothetical protein ABFS82_05G086900 [Erythranthe guttata]
MAQGNKCDAVTYLNSKLHLNLTKDNIKNRLKIWKKSLDDFNSCTSFFFAQVKVVNGYTTQIACITCICYNWLFDLIYIHSHPDAKDRATGQGAETFDEGVEAIGEEDEIEVTSAPISGSRVRPSSSTDSMNDKKKRPKKDSLAEVVSAIATSFQEFLASKRKGEEKSSGIEMHDVVSMIPGLTDDEVFKAKKDWIYFLIYS